MTVQTTRRWQYYMLYSVPSNWANMTYQVLFSMFPLPQRSFVPARIREVYKPRLEAAGLWSIPEPKKETTKPFQQVSQEAEKAENANIFLQAFDKEKAAEKAKFTLDIYSRLLKEPYFSGHDR
jgi:sorting and assembly machinery component 37